MNDEHGNIEDWSDEDEEEEKLDVCVWKSGHVYTMERPLLAAEWRREERDELGYRQQ